MLAPQDGGQWLALMGETVSLFSEDPMQTLFSSFL